MHFGANIGAAQEPGNVIQASDDAFEQVQADAMTLAGLVITRAGIPGARFLEGKLRSSIAGADATSR